MLNINTNSLNQMNKKTLHENTTQINNFVKTKKIKLNGYAG